MKTSLGEILKLAMYTTLGILFVIVSYVIIINIRHYRSLLDTVNVSEADSDYTTYKDNVNLIEERISNYSDKKSEIYLALNNTLINMKKDGIFRLVPKTKLNYHNLYELNDYYMEELINGWYHNIQNIESSKKYQDTITLLARNSEYLNDVFTNNSLILYDGKLDNKIADNYKFILNNYLIYSEVILNMCDEVGV